MAEPLWVCTWDPYHASGQQTGPMCSECGEACCDVMSDAAWQAQGKLERES